MEELEKDEGRVISDRPRTILCMRFSWQNAMDGWVGNFQNCLAGKQNQHNLGEGNLSLGERGETVFSFFSSETAIFGKQNISPNKIKVFSREEKTRMEAVPAPE